MTKIILALDGMDLPEATQLARHFEGRVWGFKVGSLLLGPASAREVIWALRGYGNVFADLKLNDTPDTVATEAGELARAGANFVSVHASAGAKALKAAAKAFREHATTNGGGILAITILTSMDQGTCALLYLREPAAMVPILADWAAEAGTSGLVCSPLELATLRGRFPTLQRVVPGVRSPGVTTHDHSRTATPVYAALGGADFIVVGREVTSATNPDTAFLRIENSIAPYRDGRIAVDRKIIPCRFAESGCSGLAVARYATPNGCACFPDDRAQDLCAQHLTKDGLGEGACLEIVYQPELFAEYFAGA